MKKNYLEEPGANADQLFELAINLKNARTFAGKGPVNGDYDWREGDWQDLEDEDLYDWEPKPIVKAQGTYGKYAQQLASGGRVGFADGTRIGQATRTSVYKFPKKTNQGKTLWYKSLDAFGKGPSKEYIASTNPFPEGSKAQKAFIKDLRKQFDHPLNSTAAKKAGVLSKEALAKKHNITFKQASLQIEKYKNKLKLEYPSPPYEGKEYKKFKQRERRQFIKKVSVPKIEKQIADLKLGTQHTDLAHRASLKHMNKLKIPYLAENLGIDPKMVNQGLVVPFEKKVEALYEKQNKLIKPYKNKPFPKTLQKEIEALNVKISDEVLKTKGTLQGILMNEKTGKYATTIGIDHKKVMGMGMIDEPVAKLTKGHLDLMKIQLPEQIKKSTELSKKISGQGLSSLAGKGALKGALKGARFIPGLGLVVTAGLGAYGLYDAVKKGYTKPSELLASAAWGSGVEFKDKDEEKVEETA